MISSTDGYCTIVTFSDGELGTPYKDQIVKITEMSELMDDSESTHTVSLPTQTESRTKVTDTLSKSPSGSQRQESSLTGSLSGSVTKDNSEKEDSQATASKDSKVTFKNKNLVFF